MMPSTTRPCGFTLIEMLVTLSLLAIMSLLTWQALDSTERASTRTQQQHHDTLIMLSVLDQLEQDITQHALLDSPYPNRAGQTTAPNTPVLPRALQWQDNRLTITRLSGDGQLRPILWQIQQQGLSRDLLHRDLLHRESATITQTPMRLNNVERWRMRVWIPQRGWMALSEVPLGLQAKGIEFLLDVRHQDRPISYRKIVLLP